MDSYAPVYKAERPKVPLNTRIKLNRQKVKKAAERAEERKAEAQLRRIPRKYREQERQMEEMTRGCRV